MKKFFVAALFISILSLCTITAIAGTFPVSPTVLSSPNIICTWDPIDPSGRPPTYVPPDYVYLGTTDDGLNIWGPKDTATWGIWGPNPTLTVVWYHGEAGSKEEILRYLNEIMQQDPIGLSIAIDPEDNEDWAELDYLLGIVYQKFAVTLEEKTNTYRLHAPERM